MEFDLNNCTLCPRECKADRSKSSGACGASDIMRVAKIMLHLFEEPPVSGTAGSGAVFFSGCPLRCGFCQNYTVSQENTRSGKACTPDELADEYMDLQKNGAHNINLVTAGHYLPLVAESIRSAKKKGLTVPVVYNSSGYEKPEALKLLEGLIDVYLPDFKYFDEGLAALYSKAADYPKVAKGAIAEMFRQTGAPVFDENGLIRRGLIIRHLVLPGSKNDSIAIVNYIADRYPGAALSLMSQYTPQFNKTGLKTLDRKLTSYEYKAVLNAVRERGLTGYCQQLDSASTRYTPEF